MLVRFYKRVYAILVNLLKPAKEPFFKRHHSYSCTNQNLFNLRHAHSTVPRLYNRKDSGARVGMVQILRPIISRGPSCMVSVWYCACRVWCRHVTLSWLMLAVRTDLTRPRLVNTCDTFRRVRPAIVAPDFFVKVRRPPTSLRYRTVWARTAATADTSAGRCQY